MNGLSGKRVVVVGASSGIGRATSQAIAREGAEVIMLSRSLAKLNDAARAIEGNTRAIAMDMLDQSAVDRTITALGGIDHLVLTAVAGELASSAPIAKLDTEQVERTFDKLRGYVNVTRAALPAMRERGSITFFSGGSALKPPREGFSVLAAAASSIIGFGKALALELAPLRVNVMMPGVVDTPIHADRRAEMRAWAESADLPAQRFGQPEDIAHAILFLLTNPYVTGHVLVVDGGYVVR